MKRMLILSVVVFSMAAAGAASKSGAPIPVPEVKITDAIELATSYFLDKETRAIDTREFKKSEYILMLAEYTNDFGGKRQKIWAWRILFVHPIANDHSVRYQVTGDRKVIFLGATE